MPRLHLVPECHAETAMVKVLFPGDVLFNHAPGINDVSKILERKDVTGYINVGFVDRDKHHVPAYFEQFELWESLENIEFKTSGGE